MDRIKVWPHMTIVALVVALVSALGVAYWMKQEQSASAEELPYAARIQRVDGEVAFSDGVANPDAEPQWITATPNQPFSVGDRIYTRDNARTSLAFSGRNFARLDPNTSLDVVNLSDRRTQLALRDGSAMFDIGYLDDDEIFEVATPHGAVNFDQPGLYNLGFDDSGGVLVSVLSGLAQIVGQGGSGNIGKGEMLTMLGQTAAQLALSRLNPDDAGYLVDDYYDYQYPDTYDGRYDSYDAYLNDPYYYDPYKRNVSYQYANPLIPGLNDLDYYGDWQQIDDYGYAWRPRVDDGWVPYQQGTWTNDYPYGPTWVSSEPWGYAPYHYGRWANVGNQWYWIPETANTTPAYAPALVAFVPLDDVNQIGWVPLGPGEAYAPHYYDANWQPQYLSRANLAPAQLINLGIPGAVTVVPVDAFGRVIEPRNVRRLESIDQQRLASVRSTLDPLTLTPLRNAVIHSAWGRGKIDLPPGIAKKLHDTPVFIGRDFKESKFRKNLAKQMRVERVSDKDRNRKFQIRDERQELKAARHVVNVEARQEDRARRKQERTWRQEEHRRTREIHRLNADRGNKDAARQVRQIEQQQKAAAQVQQRQQRDAAQVQQRQQRMDRDNQRKAQQQPPQQPQGQRVGNPAVQMKPHKMEPAARPQPPRAAQRQTVGQPERKTGKPDRKPEDQPRSRGEGGGGKAKGKGKP
ncbi:MAG TPA: FecR family protein [Pyrinomonadaceae bacterium]|nr:FecR family protein [Pyrinomonadaceae bacterium]